MTWPLRTSRREAEVTTASETMVVDVSLVGANGGKVMSVNEARWNLNVSDPGDHRIVAALLDRSSGQSQS